MRIILCLLFICLFFFNKSLPSQTKHSEFNKELISHKSGLNFNSVSQGNNEINLDQILNKCAEYCDRLSNSALFFVCQEKIDEVIYYYTYRFPFRRLFISDQPKRIEKNSYIYDYQLIKKGGIINESRALLYENGKKRHVKNAGLKTKRFYSKRSVFGPAGLLSRGWQEKYTYKVMKDDVIHGKEAVVIEAIPKEILKENPNYGKIWIQKKDFSVLKIEIEPKSLADFEILEKEARKHDVFLNISILHFYDFEKKGIRFPSRTVFKENYIDKRFSRRLKKSSVTITYDNYRFFIVETDVRY